MGYIEEKELHQYEIESKEIGWKIFFNNIEVIPGFENMITIFKETFLIETDISNSNQTWEKAKSYFVLMLKFNYFWGYSDKATKIVKEWGRLINEIESEFDNCYKNEKMFSQLKKKLRKLKVKVIKPKVVSSTQKETQ